MCEVPQYGDTWAGGGLETKRPRRIGRGVPMCAMGAEHSSPGDTEKVRIPTPEVCADCHEEQVDQFKEGKHALCWVSMKAMPTAHWQPMALMDGMKGCGGVPQDRPEDRRGDRPTEEGRRRIRRCVVRCVSYAASVQRRRSPPAAGMSDLPYGV